MADINITNAKTVKEVLDLIENKVNDKLNKTFIVTQDAEPTEPENNSIWIKSKDYTNYRTSSVAQSVTLDISSNEVIFASGEISITLHEATNKGIAKVFFNTGDNTVTLIGIVNGEENYVLFPDDSIELITDGTSWRGL